MDSSAYRRFYLGLLATAVVIATAGMAFYLDSPRVTLQPRLVHSGAPAKASVAPDAMRDRAVAATMHQFVLGFAAADTDMMRMAFPHMTRRESRIMRSIRNRLGDDASVRVGSFDIRSATASEVDLDFVINAKKPDEADTRRLSFHATMRLRDGNWVIEELR